MLSGEADGSILSLVCSRIKLIQIMKIVARFAGQHSLSTQCRPAVSPCPLASHSVGNIPSTEVSWGVTCQDNYREPSEDQQSGWSS